MSKYEKLKFASDTALCFFLITAVFNFVGMFGSSFFYTTGMTFMTQLKGSKLNYIVLVIMLISLAILSFYIRKKHQLGFAAGRKQLLLVTAGLLLIIDGIVSIPSQVSIILFYLQHISSMDQGLSKGLSEGQKSYFIQAIYWTSVPIAFSILRIGLGAIVFFRAYGEDVK